MTNLFFNKILFVVQILIAEWLYAKRLKRKGFFALRVTAGSAIIIATSAFLPTLGSWWGASLTFFFLFSLSVALMKLSFDEPWGNVVFCGIAAFTTQHFTYELSNVILSLVTGGVSPLLGVYGSEILDLGENKRWFAFYAAVYALINYVVYCAFYFTFARRINEESNLEIKKPALLLLAGICLIVDVVLNSVFVYEGKPTEQEGTNIIIFSYIIYISECLCCFLLLYVMFGLVIQKKLETELSFIKRQWYAKKEQYELSKETIEIINRKCHDMRHQIRTIGESKKIDKAVVDEIEKSVSLYDANVKTGNTVLDTILTEKSLLCYKKGIILSCVADGENIAFMEDADVYSLFGNALDNAIEAVLKLEEREKRVIDVVVYKKAGLITMNVNNAYSGKITLKDGLPVTTKGDSFYHGFGMKSIKMIVNKYGGEMNVSLDGSVFSLSIIIPAYGK